MGRVWKSGIEFLIPINSFSPSSPLLVSPKISPMTFKGSPLLFSGPEFKNAKTVLILASSKPAPLVKSPESTLRPAPSSNATPSVPNLSNLSIDRITVRRVPRSPSSCKPIFSKRPSTIFRLLTRIKKSSLQMPAASMTSTNNAHISASA